MSRSSAASIRRFASRTATGPRAAISVADRSARGATASPGRHDPLTRPIASASSAVSDAPGQDQLLGPRRADDPRQPLRPAGARG